MNPYDPHPRRRRRTITVAAAAAGGLALGLNISSPAGILVGAGAFLTVTVLGAAWARVPDLEDDITRLRSQLGTVRSAYDRLRDYTSRVEAELEEARRK